jgi:hypothetical protein
VSTTDRHQQTAVRAPAGVGVRLRVLSVNYSSIVIKEKKRGPKPNVLFFAFVDLTESVACPMSCSMFPSNSTAPKIKKNEENLLNDATCMYLTMDDGIKPKKNRMLGRQASSLSRPMNLST